MSNYDALQLRINLITVNIMCSIIFLYWNHTMELNWKSQNCFKDKIQNLFSVQSGCIVWLFCLCCFLPLLLIFFFQSQKNPKKSWGSMTDEEDGKWSTAQIVIAQIMIGQHFFRNCNCATQKMKLLKLD
jgi:ABC-type Fe3+ transport system permease subunit